jgi:UDP-N-acetylglucosamine diphosphorylase/glucosamine-1-phosphate N-acetyltransferase
MPQQKAVVILAAGKGKRMKSDLPKVLHPIKGRPMIEILLDTLTALKFDKIIVVIGHGGEEVQQALLKYPVEFAWQREQLGTGHAVMMAEPQLNSFSGITLVAAGDVPFLSADAISTLLAVHDQTKASATCLSAVVDDPTGYGRIVRGAGKDELKEIIEHKDASPEVLKLNEINTGTFCFDNASLFSSLKSVKNTNSQAEYYLTDTVKILHDNGLRVSVTVAANSDEVRGVNSPEQLDELATIFANRL